MHDLDPIAVIVRERIADMRSGKARAVTRGATRFSVADLNGDATIVLDTVIGWTKPRFA